MQTIRGWTRVMMVGLAAMLLAAMAPAEEAHAGPLERPRRVVVTVDGSKTMDVDVVWWDQTGLMTAEHLKMRWNDMPAPDAWHLCAQLIDVDSAEDWLTMAKALSKLPDGKEWARRAAHWSFWLSAQTTIDAGKLMKEMGGPVDPKVVAPLPAGEAEPGAGPADAVHPDEANQPDDWPHAKPWPQLTAQEQAEAVAALKTEMTALEDGLNVKFNLAENDFFLFYTDMPFADVTSLMEGVNTTYSSLLRSFKLPEDQNLFWGKCVIIHCGTYELFSKVQSRAFGAGAVRHMGGMTHRRAQKVHVVTWQYPDEVKMRATIPHELVHAFMARFRTARELPLWLEEGLADYMASRVMADSPLDAERRPAGEAFIKTFGPVNALLDMRCMHDGWPGPRNAGYAVGYLLVKMMFEHNPAGTLACITAIKDGKPWEQALQEDYGKAREELVLELVSQYRKPFKKPGEVKPVEP